jgi:hypothetical protein
MSQYFMGMNSRRIRWAGYVANMREMSHEYKIPFRNSQTEMIIREKVQMYGRCCIFPCGLITTLRPAGYVVNDVLKSMWKEVAVDNLRHHLGICLENYKLPQS